MQPPTSATDTLQSIVNDAEYYEIESAVLAEAHRHHAFTWISIHMMLGLPTAILSAIAGASALTQHPRGAVLAGVLALIASVLTSIATFLNPGQVAHAHKTVSAAYRVAQGRFRLLRLRATPIASEADLNAELARLVEEWMKIADMETDIHISEGLEKKSRKVVLGKMSGPKR